MNRRRHHIIGSILSFLESIKLSLLGDIEARTAWNEAGKQLDDSSGEGNNLQLATGYACEFVSANSDSTVSKNLGNCKAFEFWIEVGSTTEPILDLNGTNHIDVASGTLDLDGGTSEAYYVNGVAGSTITTDWTHVVISQATDINVSAMRIALIAAGYGDLKIKDLKFYSTELSSVQALEAYNNPQQDKPTGATLVAAYLTGQSQVIGDGTIFDTSGNENHIVFSTSAASVYSAGVDNLVVGRQVALAASSQYYLWNGVNCKVELSSAISQISTTTNAWRIEFKNVFIGDDNTVQEIFNIGGSAASRFVIYYNAISGRFYLEWHHSGIFIAAYNSTVTPNTKYDSIVVAYSGSRTAAGITFNVDGDTSKTNQPGSGTLASTTISWSTNAFIGIRQNSNHFIGVIPQVDIYDAVSAGNLIHSFADANDYDDSVGALTATLTNLGNRTVFTEDQGNAGNDVLGTAVNLAYFAKLLNFQTPASTANKTTTINVGTVKTLVFLLRAIDKDINVTIAETGTGNTIAISSGNLVATDFDTVDVDNGGGVALTDDTWHFIALTDATGVNLSAFAIDQNATGIYLVNPRAYQLQAESSDLAALKTELEAYLP